MSEKIKENNKKGLSAIFLTVALFISAMLIYNTLYVVDQREYAIVFMFGKPVRSEKTPGMKFKVPFIHDIIFFDNRLQNITFSPQGDNREVMAFDQKTMKLDAFAKYRIVDPLLFYQKVRSERNFRRNITPIIESSIREVVGTVPFLEILGKQREYVISEINKAIKTQAKHFGVEIVDVRILRINLPDKAKNAVYARMRTDREKEAREIRATGIEEAKKVQAFAQRERTVMIAKATSESEVIRGKGDAKAIEIFAQVAKQDVDFFTFYRTISSYEKALTPELTGMFLSMDGNFLKYLNNGSK